MDVAGHGGRRGYILAPVTPLPECATTGGHQPLACLPHSLTAGRWATVPGVTPPIIRSPGGCGGTARTCSEHPGGAATVTYLVLVVRAADVDWRTTRAIIEDIPVPPFEQCLRRSLVTVPHPLPPHV